MRINRVECNGTTGSGFLNVLCYMVLVLTLLSCGGEIGYETEGDSEVDSQNVFSEFSFSQGAVYDFVARAPSAGWHTQYGNVPWGERVTGRGIAIYRSGKLENGETAGRVLLSQPASGVGKSAGQYMHGRYNRVTIPAATNAPILVAEFGFREGASASDGVIFSITTPINGRWVPLFKTGKQYDGRLKSVRVDLRPWSGRTLDLFLNVDAGNNNSYDWAIWKSAKIVCERVAYDFIVRAPSAGWHTQYGNVPWGALVSGGGIAAYRTGQLENGENAGRVLLSHPASGVGKSAGHYMHGRYNRVTIPAATTSPTLAAEFGFREGASASDGVIFSITAPINGRWVPLFKTNKQYDGRLKSIRVDLSPWSGQTLDLFLNVDAGNNNHYDWAIWKSARIVTTGGEPWVLEWHDEFNQPGAPDPNKWQVNTGALHKTNPELNHIMYASNSAENVRVEGGRLILQILKNSPAQMAERNTLYSGAWLTGKNGSWDHGPTARKLEARIKFPCANGTHTGFWTTGIIERTSADPAYDWPGNGEIDIAEHIGRKPEYVNNMLHYNNSDGHHATTGEHRAMVEKVCGKFHRFAMEWTDEDMTFAMDEKIVQWIDTTQLDVETVESDPQYHPFINNPHLLRLSSELGKTWAGWPTKGADKSFDALKNDQAFKSFANTLFANPELTKFEIDYVRIYRLAE